jgi:hypothetical protein
MVRETAQRRVEGSQPMDGTPYVNLTIDSTDGQLRVEGPFSLLRTYVRAFVANDATEPDPDTFEALVVAVVALIRIRDASPPGGPIAYYATTALTILRDEHGFGAAISEATRALQNGGPNGR